MRSTSDLNILYAFNKYDEYDNCIEVKEIQHDGSISITTFQFQYDDQNNWASGNDINDINESLKEIGKKFGANNVDIKKCLNDEKMEEKILEKFLNAKKEFKIKSTPTIFINEKKYEGKHSYKNFKKVIEKLL